jgi:hypothetical protein
MSKYSDHLSAKSVNGAPPMCNHPYRVQTVDNSTAAAPTADWAVVADEVASHFGSFPLVALGTAATTARTLTVTVSGPDVDATNFYADVSWDGATAGAVPVSHHFSGTSLVVYLGAWPAANTQDGTVRVRLVRRQTWGDLK